MAVKNKLLLTLIFLAGTCLHAFSDQTEPLVISVKAIPGLQYDLPRFSVKPGANVKLVFTNNDDMSHNLLITRPGARKMVVEAALKMGEQGHVQDFIPATSDVLWSIPVVSPGETKILTFTAPEMPGVYPYVCTYPGHGFVMYGAMYVTTEGLPLLKDDINVPPGRRDGGEAGSRHAGHNAEPSHPFPEMPPYLYRTFTVEAGAATIAVRLPGELSYFWDAATCRLRLVSKGAFLDMSTIWAGHRQATAKNLGKVLYRDPTTFPLHIGVIDSFPKVRFKGYRLVDRYPEFHYTLNGTDVYELIKESHDGNGIKRTFRIPEYSGSVWFMRQSGDGVDYASSSGKWESGMLQLTAAEAKQFTLTMTIRQGGL